VEQSRQFKKLATSDRHRKKSTHPFGEGEELFRKIFNHTNDSILIIDPERDKIIDVNPKACDMLKYSREELLSTSISAIHPKDVPKLLTFTQSVYKQGRGWTDELTCLTKKGETLSAEISASVIDIGERAYIIALVRDMTVRLWNNNLPQHSHLAFRMSC
jgi:PAS domain S-box-containing protein